MANERQAAPPRVLPRGRHAVPADVVQRSQRERLLAGMALAVAEKGYARTAVADVLPHAGVSRKTFYEHFANKRECLLAAYDHEVGRLMGAIDAELAAHADPFAAAAAGVRAYLGWIAAHPVFAQTFFVEILAAGPDALARRAAVHERFAEQLQAFHAAARTVLPELPDPPPARFRATVGATNELVLEHLRLHGAEGLEALADAVLDVQLALLAGPT